jgi:lantibiotic modifying enzyme
VTLLTGAAADEARAAIAEIAAALRDPATADVDPDLRSGTLGRGSAGAALFFAQLAAETGNDGDAETALAFLDVALDRAADEMPTALLYPGTVGVGWTLAYLEGRLLDPDDGPNDVDELVARAVADAPWPSADLIRGVTGTGVYLLERLPQPGARTALDLVVAKLTEMAETFPEGTTWYVPPEGLLEDRKALYPEGYYDVGMAHGQAGTVAMLAAALAAGVDSAKPLLESATAWLLAQRLPDDEGPGRYPLIIDKRDHPPRGGRFAWCYGDAGVAVALLAAGRALHDEAILREAHDLAVTSIPRQDGVVDAPLCHGSAGLLQVYLRLAQGTGDERLNDAARTWADVTLHRHRRPDGIAGYGSVRPTDDDDRPWVPLAGFLEGAAGVGLALLAATSDHAPDWDTVLMTKPVPA